MLFLFSFLMKEKNIIAIDLGTTHCKAVIINTKGKVLKTFQVATKPLQPKPGWNEQDPEEIFNEVLKLLKQSFSFCNEKNIGSLESKTKITVARAQRRGIESLQ